MPTRDQQVREYRKFVESMRRTWNSESSLNAYERRQKLDAWFNQAPNICGQLFTFPMPRPV